MKFKKYFTVLLSVLVIGMGFMAPVSAKDYTKRTAANTKSVASGTVKIYGNATYHSTGNTRWNYYWEVYSGSNIKSCFVKSTTHKIPSDTKLTLCGTFSATNNSYVSGTTSASVTFTYKNGAVSYSWNNN